MKSSNFEIFDGRYDPHPGEPTILPTGNERIGQSDTRPGTLGATQTIDDAATGYPPEWLPTEETNR